MSSQGLDQMTSVAPSNPEMLGNRQGEALQPQETKLHAGVGKALLIFSSAPSHRALKQPLEMQAQGQPAP